MPGAATNGKPEHGAGATPQRHRPGDEAPFAALTGGRPLLSLA
ncbi:MAG TPA: hypothetical protein VGK53_19810 [Propionicimonas sp.]|jgi:hypothetical protein